MSSMHGKSVHPKCGNVKSEKENAVICSSTKFSTVVSGKSYRCRSCGKVFNKYTTGVKCDKVIKTDENGNETLCNSNEFVYAASDMALVDSEKSYRCRSCGEVREVSVIVPVAETSVVETVPEVVATEPVAVVP